MVRKTTARKQNYTAPDSLHFSPFAIAFITVAIFIILFSFSESTALLRSIDYTLGDLITQAASVLKQIMDLF